MDESSLFTAQKLRDICAIDETYVRSFYRTTCPSHTLGFYVAYLQGKACSNLTEEDVTKAKQILQKCVPYYRNTTSRTLLKTQTCNSAPCKDNIPRDCFTYNAVYKILYFLTDTAYANSADLTTATLKYSMLVYHDTTQDDMGFFDANVEKGLEYGSVKLVGLSLTNVKTELFNKYLIDDIYWFGLAGATIIVLMLFYTFSPLLVLATLINVGFSFGVAYFVYFLVIGMKFFPFLNILAALLLIAIGADDVFIVYDIWKQAKEEKQNFVREEWVLYMMRHAVFPCFITSLTTGAAFFACLTSKITTIRLFGIFSGVAIMVNFIFVVTWIPAVIVCRDMLCSLCSSNKCPSVSKMCHSLDKKIFGVFFPKVISKMKYVFIVLFTLLGIGGIVAIFFYPKLRLPSSREFQLFSLDNPFEWYDFKLKNLFQFEIETSAEYTTSGISIYDVWGIKGEDNGDYLDPNSEGYLEMDPTSDVTSPASINWLDSYCNNLINQSFVSQVFRLEHTCFTSEYKQLMSAPCGAIPGLNGLPQPCCNRQNFTKDINEFCLPRAHIFLYQKFRQRLLGNPLYDSTNQVKGFFLQYSTRDKWSMSYSLMDEIWNMLEGYMQGELAKAPPGVQNGWFTGGRSFEFYDLQNSIAYGTYSSMGVSLGVAFLVMLFTSLNLLVTLYAILTIALAIFVTIGILVLQGWELNILESISISLAVGLSIDFTIHYGVAYRLSGGATSIQRVKDAYIHVGSAVLMAALTTFCAGSAMMWTRVTAYSKLGVFLMVVMAISWAYATLFFQSICHVIGPRGRFCQISTRCCSKGISDNDSAGSTQAINDTRDDEVNGMTFMNTVAANLPPGGGNQSYNMPPHVPTITAPGDYLDDGVYRADKGRLAGEHKEFELRPREVPPPLPQRL